MRETDTYTDSVIPHFFMCLCRVCIILNWNLEEATPNRDLLTDESRAWETELWGRYINSEWKGIQCLKSKEILFERGGWQMPIISVIY